MAQGLLKEHLVPERPSNYRSVGLLPIPIPLQPLSCCLRGMEVWLPNGTSPKICVVTDGPCSVSGSAGCQGAGVSNKRSLMARSHHPLLSHTLWGVDGWDELSGHSWPGVGYMAWNSTERSLPYGRRLSFFLPAWKRVTLDQFVLEVIGQGYSLPFVRQPSLSLSPFGDSVTHPAVQTTSAVGRGFGPRGPWRLLICHGTRGRGELLPLLPGY